MAKRYGVTRDGRAVAAVEVDGVPYPRADDVPDPADREAVRRPGAAGPPDPTPATPLPVEKVVAGVFAAVLLLVAALTGASTARSLAREVRADGRVVDLTARTVEVPQDPSDPNRGAGRDRAGVLRPGGRVRPAGRDPDDGPDGRGELAPAYERGQAVTVRYDPDDPLAARIASPSGALLRWAWPLITGGLGLAFAAAAALADRAFVRR